MLPLPLGLKRSSNSIPISSLQSVSFTRVVPRRTVAYFCIRNVNVQYELFISPSSILPFIVPTNDVPPALFVPQALTFPFPSTVPENDINGVTIVTCVPEIVKVLLASRGEQARESFPLVDFVTSTPV
jgi:hypothetical protein